MSEISPEIRHALNHGETESITLVEWLAVDASILLHVFLKQAGVKVDADELDRTAAEASALKIMQRTAHVGAFLFELDQRCARRGSRAETGPVFAAAAAHPSDSVRAWAAYSLLPRKLTLERRIALTRPFAADPHMGVRECAWMTCRDSIIAELPRAIELLAPAVRDPDPNIRRFATEATRPRGVWCRQIDALKSDPAQAISLLDPVKSDSSEYVRRSLGNWLNDASKSRPDWVREVCAKWLKESRTKETAWIVNHAQRTMRKQK